MQPSQFAVRSSGDAASARAGASSDAPLGRVVSVSGSRAVVAVGADVQRAQPGRSALGRQAAGDRGRAVLDRRADLRGGGGGSDPAEHDAREHRAAGRDPPVAPPARASFDRGIRTYPPVGAAVHEMDTTALETIYDYHGKQTISIGKLSQDDSIEATRPRAGSSAEAFCGSRHDRLRQVERGGAASSTAS